MGCDIHTRAEKRVNGNWQPLEFEPFRWRSYAVFGFLADVRNYSAVPPISPARGFPDDFMPDLEYPDSRYDVVGDHSYSWLSLAELLAFDYNQTFEDRRVTREISPGYINGGVTGDPGEGEIITYRDFLGDAFFKDLEKLKELGAERIVFGFDS